MFFTCTLYIIYVMSSKEIHQILTPPFARMVGTGFRVHNFFPMGYWIPKNGTSPFILLDYNSKIYFPPSKTSRGVDVHPHRGFETVTIVYHGRVAHQDSSGNKGIIREGDVQWMTAGSGILHKEFHEEKFCKNGGVFQLVQLWVNLPAKNKMTNPKYQSIKNKQIGKYPLPADMGVIEVIAGEYRGVKGAASTFTPIELYNVRAKKGAGISLEFPSVYNTGILIIEGSVKVNNSASVPVNNFVLFKNSGEEIFLNMQEDSVFLVMSGEPIDEPVVAQGPFVMNSKEEIAQAYQDLNAGKFGLLE